MAGRVSPFPEQNCSALRPIRYCSPLRPHEVAENSKNLSSSPKESGTIHGNISDLDEVTSVKEVIFKNESVSSPADEKTQAKSTSSVADTSLICHVCGKVYRNRLHFTKHKDLHKVNECRQCSEMFSTPYQLRRHVYKVHKGKGFSCDLCQQSFFMNYQLEAHKNTHSSEKNFKCVACNKQFKVKRNLETHMKSHTGSRDYKCEVCDKDFPYKFSLKIHMTTHSQPKVECPACKKLVTENYLRQHLKTHELSETLFDCDMCDAKFVSVYRYKEHKRRHNTSYVCDLCGKVFTNTTGLKLHMRIHSGEKPYTCAACGKSFVSKSILVVHTRVHTKEKPYVCEICDKRFTQKTSLTTHMKVHAGDMSHVCNVCDRTFAARSVLKTHLKSHGVLSHEIKSN